MGTIPPLALGIFKSTVDGGWPCYP